ncbi:MAG TPA: hypothetical protein VM142_09320 [Acidimicrobiales bacterium]|nr:hypothetical protein [Acidimicrobiales bacterium]
MSVLQRLSGVGLAITMTAGGLAAMASPASANHTAPYDNGTGGFTATAAATFVPPAGEPAGSAYPCSLYTAYETTLRFANGAVANIHSNPGVSWAEGPYGTYGKYTPTTSGLQTGPPDAPVCPDVPNPNAPPATTAISGFSGLLTVGTSVCQLGNPADATSTAGTYRRGKLGTGFEELNVNFVLPVTPLAGSLGCPASPVTIRTTVAHVKLGPTALATVADGPGPLFSLLFSLPIVGPILEGIVGTPYSLLVQPLYDAFVGGQEYIAVCSTLIAPSSCSYSPYEHPLTTTP